MRQREGHEAYMLYAGWDSSHEPDLSGPSEEEQGESNGFAGGYRNALTMRMNK